MSAESVSMWNSRFSGIISRCNPSLFRFDSGRLELGMKGRDNAVSASDFVGEGSLLVYTIWFASASRLSFAALSDRT